MRTTIDIPDEVHERLRRMAFEQRTSLTRLASELLQAGLDRPRVAPDLVLTSIDPETGLPTVRFGRGTIRDEDVREADDEW